VLGISLDDPKTLDDLSLLEFKKRRKINYQILRGTEQVTEEYFRGIRLEIPALFIIDRDGMIVDRHKGFDLGDVEKALQKLL
jgi:peroxiredoxin